MKQYTLSLHIFRRDLRLEDNTALIEALELSDQVLPCFIFDKRQIEDNPYKSKVALSFMANSLNELDAELKKRNSRLFLFYGIAEEVIDTLLQEYPIKAVFLNRDYTPFSRQRDASIEKICHSRGVDYQAYADLLLCEPEEVQKANGAPYTIFTYFHQKALCLSVATARSNPYENYYQQSIGFEDKKILPKLLSGSEKFAVNGGRSEALSLLKEINQLSDYKNLRNFPAKQCTTKLSAHNKFGTISIREFYAAITEQLSQHNNLITELYWRDFFTHIAFHFPHVFERAFQNKYADIPWENNVVNFEAWCNGRTGFPIVDAGMRELNLTGYMHNRLRMITASFLVKNLHIDWRWGEKYFAQKLVDYDAAVNNGNWQWAASTGCDAQPYFRIFNPWLQQAKYDAECVYIKHYVPELESLTAKEIHQLAQKFPIGLRDYPKPIVEHASSSLAIKKIYKNLK